MLNFEIFQMGYETSNFILILNPSEVCTNLVENI